MRLPSQPVTLWGSASLLVLLTNAFAPFAPIPEIDQPGTQPLQASLLGGVSGCDGCHGGYDQAVEPLENWMGSMMAHSTRDPVFWAALAVADSDFPGAGNYCIRCHAPRGFLEGRANATDGSTLTSADQNGIECGICHNMVNPNGQEHAGVQTAPFVANSGGTPPEGYHGSAMLVMAGNSVRYGPYNNATAGHAWAQSQFHRSAEICGTCHEVSNPLTGDLAPNNGAQVPLAPGSFSGVAGAPVGTKAAFNNPPYKYGIVERTYSELKASGLEGLRLRDVPTLPADVRRGAIARAHQKALLTGPNADYEDGTPRTFNCQACHMEPTVGEGAAFGLAPVRYDLAIHDLTGANTWVPDAIRWLDGQGRLRLGGGLLPRQSQAMDRGILRARGMLQRAAALDVQGAGSGTTLRVTNLTGHKLITGYPEGRRMWLRTRWKNEQGQVLREDGSYGSFTATVNGTPYTVQSITDPNARVYQAKLGITRDWALELLQLGVNPNLPLAFDRTTGAVTMTLVQLASQPAGAAQESFHFVLNDRLLADNRIPPYRMDRNEATRRNALPVPASQYGNPAAGGVYRHYDEVPLQPPAGATRAEIELLHQVASWEYIQFLLLANPGTSPFLANVGQDLFDAWRNTGQSAPERMALARWCSLPGSGGDLQLESGVNGAATDTVCGKRLEQGDTVQYRVRSPNGTLNQNLGALIFQLHDAPAPPQPFLPGIRLDRVDAQLTLVGLPVAGATSSITIPPSLQNLMIRAQAVVLTPNAPGGVYVASNALDVWVP